MPDFKQIQSIAKKNAVSLAAGVIAVAAAAVAFIVPPTMLAKTKGDIEQRAAEVKSVNEMERKQHHLPVVNVDGAAEAQPLTVFPNKNVAKAGQDAVDELKKQSDAALAEAIAFGKYKTLVSQEVFTATGGRYQELSYRFRDDYAKFVPDGLNKIMNAAAPPSQEEINARVVAEKERISSTMPIKGANGQVLNQDDVTRALQDAELAVPQKMREEVGSKSSLYVARDAWSFYTALSTTGTQPLRDDLWFAQLGLWIQQDIAETIAAANAGSKSINTSPVKHLIKVTMDPNPYIVPRDTAGLVTVTGVNPAAAVTLNRAYSVTGHVGNGLYDVVRYQLLVRVAENRVPEFLAEIPKNRLHYVTNVNMRSIDANVEAGSGGTTSGGTGGGVVYGAEPVVEIAVDCEALFIRKTFEAMMPRNVRSLIGIDPPLAAPTPG